MITINALLAAYLCLYLITSLLDVAIDLINKAHLRKYGDEVPDAFKGMIDGERLKKITDYTIDNTALTITSTIISKITFLFIILSGILPWFVEATKDYHFILAGLLFFAIPGLAGALVDLPFAYYHIFRIEERYGFNTRTLKIWILDLLKSMLIAVILGSVLLSLLLIMVKYAGSGWWVWAWLIFVSFQLLVSVLYPTVLAPIFNKFIPIQDDELAQRIGDLADKEGLTIKGIFQMDAARRSRHTNAYFSGLGKAKRIVLFDTLLEAHEQDEVLAVLAHEIGHQKMGHIKKQLLIMGIASFILFFLASWMITWSPIYESFGFNGMASYVGLFLIAVLWEPVGFFLSPLAMAVSRRFEREADGHAYRVIQTTGPFIRALKKMARDNLSNLHPHPMYVRFNYSHPPLLERIKHLEDMDEQTRGA